MNFSFIQITDHHIAESEEMLVEGFSPAHALRRVMQHIAQNTDIQVDFIFSTGDLVENATNSSYKTFKRILALKSGKAYAPGPLLISRDQLPQIPFYCLPGNHDDRENFFRNLFPNSSPVKLMNAAFTHKGIQFICLDWGPESKAITHTQTLDFLKSCLQTENPSIILMHYQLVKIGSRWLDDLLSDNLDLFWQTIAGRNILSIFCGHVHTTYERVVENIPVFGLRSTSFPFVLQDEPLACLLPPHYRVVTIENGILSTKIYEVTL